MDEPVQVTLGLWHIESVWKFLSQTCHANWDGSQFLPDLFLYCSVHSLMSYDSSLFSVFWNVLWASSDSTLFLNLLHVVLSKSSSSSFSLLVSFQSSIEESPIFYNITLDSRTLRKSTIILLQPFLHSAYCSKSIQIYLHSLPSYSHSFPIQASHFVSSTWPLVYASHINIWTHIFKLLDICLLPDILRSAL